MNAPLPAEPESPDPRPGTRRPHLDLARDLRRLERLVTRDGGEAGASLGAAVRSALDDLAKARVRVAVVGGAGVGKSTLLERLRTPGGDAADWLEVDAATVAAEPDLSSRPAPEPPLPDLSIFCIAATAPLSATERPALRRLLARRPSHVILALVQCDRLNEPEETERVATWLRSRVAGVARDAARDASLDEEEDEHEGEHDDASPPLVVVGPDEASAERAVDALRRFVRTRLRRDALRFEVVHRLEHALHLAACGADRLDAARRQAESALDSPGDEDRRLAAGLDRAEGDLDELAAELDRRRDRTRRHLEDLADRWLADLAAAADQELAALRPTDAELEDPEALDRAASRRVAEALGAHAEDLARRDLEAVDEAFDELGRRLHEIGSGLSELAARLEPSPSTALVPSAAQAQASTALTISPAASAANSGLTAAGRIPLQALDFRYARVMDEGPLADRLQTLFGRGWLGLLGRLLWALSRSFGASSGAGEAAGSLRRHGRRALVTRHRQALGEVLHRQIPSRPFRHAVVLPLERRLEARHRSLGRVVRDLRHCLADARAALRSRCLARRRRAGVDDLDRRIDELRALDARWRAALDEVATRRREEAPCT